MASNLVVDTDSEDELPAGWEERVTTNGKVYYANHELLTTQWDHPVSGKKKIISGELPFGWEMKVNEEGNVFYVDHLNKKTTYTDPRLAFAVEDTSNDEGPKEIKQKFDASSTALQVLMGRDLSKKYFIVTGGNSGLGLETCRSLASHGGNVVMACRDLKSGNAAVKQIKTEKPEAELNIEAMKIDLLNLRSVKLFVENYKAKDRPLHVLILNAGVFSMPYTVSEDGYEATFQTNYLAHFYLVQMFKDLLQKSAPARIIILSAESHRFTELNADDITEHNLSPEYKDYIPIIAYNQSKLCDILLCKELSRRFKRKEVSCFAVHPGNVISTGLSRNWWFWRVLFTLVRPFAKSKQQGSACTVYCATARELEWSGGLYFNNCCICEPHQQALNKVISRKLWEISEDMVQKAKTLQNT